MKAELHRKKAERVERTMAKLNPADHHEAIIDACMVIAGHWINYALHRIGITADDHDVVHAYFVTEFEREYWAMAAGPEYVDALEAIESFRPPYVRGDAKGGPQAACKAVEHIASLRKKARAARPRKVSGPIALPVCRM
jgi:hypothetical protein